MAMNDVLPASLSEILGGEDVVVGLRTETLREAVSRLLAKAGTTPESVAAVVDVVMKREAEGSTCMPPVALPHGRTNEVTRIVAGLGINPEGVVRDRPEMTIVLAFVSPVDASSLHLRFLSGVAKLLRRESVVAELLAAPDPSAVLEIIRAGGC
jgi:mannitol/fructose-specific phosphotransferase system IIA component (Ntr-type)